VIVELDGWPFHSSRFSFEDDRERDAITTAAGFVTVRITRQRFERQPEREADRLRAILAQRRSA
jgi:very-short-patch-repair endonuclease